MEELSQYDMVIKHRPGKNHGNADGLSRIVEDERCSGVRMKLPYAMTRSSPFCTWISSAPIALSDASVSSM
jgi:hypothetical protein